MKKALLNPEVQEFIRTNLRTDLSELILKGSPFKEIPSSDLAIQISGLKKAEKKLPSWYKAKGIIYPPNLNLEQTSSEVTAEYKADQIRGKTIIDITGGFGIDSYYFSRSMEKVVHCELNPELSETAAHNFEVLGAENIIPYTGNGIEYLENSEVRFDYLYVDPARRNDYGGKVFLLDQCTPNVPYHLDLFFEKANKILIKTSPLLDLKAGLGELKNVAEIHIVAVRNEVKELLWFLDPTHSKNIKIKTINILKDRVQEFEANMDALSIDAGTGGPREYLYEPNAAIMKSGLFAELASKTGTVKLHANSHLYTSDEIKNFPGRRFRVMENLPYNKKLLKKRSDLKKANVTTRNFPKTVETIRKELKIEDGGTVYLFFTTGPADNKIVLVCEKV